MVLMQCLLSGWSLAIAVADWRMRRIPNGLLLLGCALVAVYWGLVGEGPLGLSWRSSLIGLGFGALVWMPGYLLGQVGAGDVKLAACCGLLLGAYQTVLWLLLGAVLLGMLSLALKLTPSLARRLQRGEARAGRVIPVGACMMPAFVAVMWWPALAGSGLPG
jgi:prepilin peptidase CpaA